MLERPELKLLEAAIGRPLSDPYQAVELFESEIATFTGARYGIAVDCATHAIELSFRYLQAQEEISVPAHTYPSVPFTVARLGARIAWKEEKWQGVYRLDPYPVVDASLRFREGMHCPGDFTCLSFQHKKRLPIGRGGMILCDDLAAYRWLKKACHDGRQPGVRWHADNISLMGWHYYMTPEDAARGLLLFRALGKDLPDLGGWENYPDIRRFEAFHAL